MSLSEADATCGACGTAFAITSGQIRHLLDPERNVYCADCRRIDARKR